MNKFGTLLLGLLSLSACVAMLPPVSPMQAEWARTHWSDMDEGSLGEARRLYSTRCSGCHNLVLPNRHSLDQWDVILTTMAPRAKINEWQKEQIRRYIITAKSAPTE